MQEKSKLLLFGNKPLSCQFLLKFNKMAIAGEDTVSESKLSSWPAALASPAGSPGGCFVCECYPVFLETSWCIDKPVQKIIFLPMFKIIHQAKTTKKEKYLTT